MEYSFVLKEDNFVAGDIVLWDADNEEKVIVKQEEYSTINYETSRYTPIGIVVIPASHMDDGKARMTALRWMSCNNPENGSIEPENMLWGVASDLSGLTNFTDVPIVSSDTVQTIDSINSDGYLSSNYSGYTGTSNPQDSGTRWYYNNNNSLVASPYTSDGTPNPLYRATSYSGGSINNALSYFDGRHQTDVILEARGEKDYGSWKPGNEIPEDYPAASCCDMYHTVGTKQGDWYLPSVAELGYIVARLNDINIPNLGNDLFQLQYQSAWSSTEHDSSIAMVVLFSQGLVRTWHTKDSIIVPVVAFASV